jgi:hypothetical protein
LLQHIANLAKQGLTACQRQGQRGIAFVSSDHGSTLLPPDAPTLRAPGFAHELDDEQSADDGAVAEGRTREGKSTVTRTRAYTLDRLPTDAEQRGLAEHWYLLHKDVFELHQHFLIPKGYAAVGRRPSGWTHGGASPEEVVTAFIELRPEIVMITEPSVNVQGSLVSGKLSELVVVITNPNRMPLENIVFRLRGTPEQASVGMVSPISYIETKVSALIESARSTAERLGWSLRCRAGGQEYCFTGSVVVRVRRLYTSDLDDMFEELK